VARTEDELGEPPPESPGATADGAGVGVGAGVDPGPAPTQAGSPAHPPADDEVTPEILVAPTGSAPRAPTATPPPPRPRPMATPAAEPDRDQVDFTPVTTWLRTRRIIGPPRPRRPPPSILIPAAERTVGGEPVGGLGVGAGVGAGAGAGAGAGSSVVDRLLGDRRPQPAAPGEGLALPWQQLDWTPDAARRPIERDRLARILLVAATVGYVWLFAYWTMRNHDGYGTQAFDFGIYDQGLWLLSRFKRPFVTIMGRHLFGDHTSFILLPLVPVYWILPSAKVLLFTQAAALGGAAVPAFLLAREKLRSERLAALLACVYLLHPAIAFVNLEQFHPDAFEPILILFALWFMVRKRWVGFLICCAVVLLVKEDVALLIFPLGLYVAIRHDRRIGAIACIMSLTMLSAALWWILPMYNGVGSLNSWRVPFGGVGGLVKTFFLHPGEVVTYATEKPRTWYVWQMFTPVAFLPLLDLRLFAVMVAPLATNVLSTFYYQYDIHYHYGTMIVPMLVATTIFAVARARSMAGRQIMVGLVVACSLVTAYLWGPTPLGRHEAPIASPDGNSIPYLERANRIIPKDAVLSAFYGYVPHFDHRVEIYMFPNPFKASYWGTFKTEGQRLPQADRVEYILLPTILDPEPQAVLDQVRDQYDTVFEEGNVTLLRKKGVSPP